MTNNTDLCEQFFQATTAGDADALERLCSNDFTGTQNGGPAMNRKTLIRFSVAVKKAIPDFHYENPVRTATEHGFVEEHDVCGTLPDGSRMQFRVVVIGEADNGQIIALREYFDSRPAMALMKALQ
ncbi:MAG: nuclear transport factor 2 family protein [Pseudomonadales bacterium]|nr:nuclear transport factor 2 family protein [Pseudomonadales bacterium]